LTFEFLGFLKTQSLRFYKSFSSPGYNTFSHVHIVCNPLNFYQEHLCLSALRGHDYKLLKRHCHSHARLTFFSYRVVTCGTIY